MVEFRLLGPVEGRADDGRRLDLGTRQQRFVLAVLLLEANHVVPAVRLVELLWPDDPPRSARQSVQVRISRLRGVLGTSVPVISEGAGYRLQVDPLAVDVHRFRAGLGAAREAVNDGADDRAVELFRTALALWSGEPLAGTAAENVRQQLCHGLEEARLVALEDCLDAELRLGRHAAVLDELTDLVRTHPTRERLVGQLMHGLHRCGQTVRALEVARDTRALLADELGIDPGVELRDLEVAILRDDPALQISTQTPAEATQQPGRALVPAQLPPAVSGFTGRSVQLGELDRCLAPEPDHPAAARIVVMSGMGGLGKTALVLHWAHRVAEQFPDGQLYLDLRGHAAVPAVQPVEALAYFLRGIGFDPAMIPTDLDAATATYRSAVAGRSLLVVLDNAADAAQVRPLLPAGPDCLTLVTSRDRLAGLVARDGARRLPLDTLTTDEAIELLERLLGPARAAAEADAMAALTRLCAQLPLALRIAAGYLTDNPRHSVEAYVDQLREGDLLDALTVDGDDDAAIRATFDLSYRRLGSAERRMFRLLGLVPGPDVTVGAAAALAGVSLGAAAQQLARLCTSHLLTEHVQGRYSLHDLLREYARLQAESAESDGDRGAAVERLMAWYYVNTRAADVQLSPTLIRLPEVDLPSGLPPTAPPGDTDAALAWFTSEGANLRSAVTHCTDRGPHRWAWLIAEFERHHLGAVGDLVGKAIATRQAVEAAEHCAGPAALTSAYLGWADALSREDPSRARDVLTAAIPHAERAADPEWLASTLNDLAGFHVRLGDYATAYTLLGKVVEHNARLSPAGSDPRTRFNFGILAMIRGNLSEAAGHLRAAADAYAAVDAARKEAYALITLAEVTDALGRPEEALALLDRAVTLAEESGSHRTVEALGLRTVVCIQRGSLDAVEAEMPGLIAAAESAMYPEVVCQAYAARGELRRLRGDDAGALRDHDHAVRVARDSGHQYLSLRMLVGLANAQAGCDSDGDAHQHAHAALASAERCGARVVEADALTVLATVERGRGNVEAAVAHAEAALALHRQTGHHLGTARANRALGLALTESDALDTQTQERARSCLQRAQELFDSYGSYEAKTASGDNR